VNTVEVCSIETACLEGTISKYPHNVEYLIRVNYDREIKKLVVSGGNSLGEVYIYQVEEDYSLTLIDMILTNSGTIRTAHKLNSNLMLVSGEKGLIDIFNYTPKVEKKMDFDLEAMNIEEKDDENQLVMK